MGEEVTLALSVRAPVSSSLTPGQLLAAWHILIKGRGRQCSRSSRRPGNGHAFPGTGASAGGVDRHGPPERQGSGRPDHWKLFPGQKLLLLATDGLLEYAVTLVSSDPVSEKAHPQITLTPGEQVLLGTLAIRGSGVGTARIALIPRTRTLQCW